MSHPMIPSRRARRFLLACVVLAVASFALGSCGQKLTPVPPTYNLPAGTLSPDARLLLWPDQPNVLYYFDDTRNPGPDPADTLLYTVNLPASPSADLVIDGLILDHTDATQFQVFRADPNGGVRQFLDFPAERTRRWLTTQWEAYRFADPTPSGHQPPTYLARGLIGDVANSLSPLTNVAVLGRPTLDNFMLRASWTKKRPPQEPTSHLNVAWDPVPGADRYLIHIYTFRSDADGADIMMSGRPEPFYLEKPFDYFLGFVDKTVDSLAFFAGNPQPLSESQRSLVTTFASSTIRELQTVYVRGSAIDAQGRVLATVRGPDNILQALPWDVATNKANLTVPAYAAMVPFEKSYLLYRLGAAIPGDPNASSGGSGGGGEP